MLSTHKQNFHYASADVSFHFHHTKEDHPNPRDHKLHYEHGYEIYMFISGSGSYTVEGNRYELEPYSIMMMNPNELHILNISEQMPYERIVLIIHENFLPPFMLNGVDFFRSLKFRKLGHDNQIIAETVQNSGLLDLFEKLQQHLELKNAENEFVAKCIIVQILSTLNHIANTDLPSFSRKASYKISAVLEFINSNLEQPLNLDSLSEHFFITKYHLCRTFKEATGYSINQYITYKRIRMADGLMLEGFTPTQACFMSGFNNYSNFFKSYRKLTGRSPKTGRISPKT